MLYSYGIYLSELANDLILQDFKMINFLLEPLNIIKLIKC